METKLQKQYETPATTVVDLNFEGFLCSSQKSFGTSDYIYGDLDEE